MYNRINYNLSVPFNSLQATAMDVRTAHLNQPVEVASLRPQFAKSIGISSGRPDLVIRFVVVPKCPDPCVAQ